MTAVRYALAQRFLSLCGRLQTHAYIYTVYWMHLFILCLRDRLLVFLAHLSQLNKHAV